MAAVYPVMNDIEMDQPIFADQIVCIIKESVTNYLELPFSIFVFTSEKFVIRTCVSAFSQ